MNGIFDEHRMIQVLETCIPNGETLTAGIHGVTLQVNKKKHQDLMYILVSQKTI